jgi:3-(3-hydroxy-phenyl)propionate hydroxylase
MRELLRPLTAPPRRLVSGCFDAGSPLGGRHLPQVPVRVRGGRDAVMLDDVLGYRPALLTRGERADEAAEWAQARGVAAHRVGREIVDDDGRLSAWMDRHRCDFALVRPDRVVFGAGRARDLARVGRAHDAWLGGRADAAPPEDARARAR